MDRSRKLRLSVVVLGLVAASWACGAASAREPAAPTPRAVLLQPSSMAGISLARPAFETRPAFILEPILVSAQPSNPVEGHAILASPESRRLTLEYPSWIRIGDSSVIRLTLDAASLANATTMPAVGGNLTADPNVNITNPHENYNVIAEARLDLEGTEVRPRETVSEPLVPGESVAFRWSVRTTQTGTYRGTAWLVLVFVDRSSGVQTRTAVSAQPVKIQATSLLGLGGGAARVLGALGTALAGVLGIPFIPAVQRRNRSRRRINA